MKGLCEVVPIEVVVTQDGEAALMGKVLDEEDEIGMVP